MIYIILLFSLINTIKSITLSEYYNNFLILSIFPFEIALLSFNNTFTDIIFKWIFIGWFMQENELKYIDNIQEYNEHAILISWLITFLNLNIYIFLKYRKKITKFIYTSYLLKFIIINYTSLFLWSLNILLNYEKVTILILSLINVYIFNFIAFWFPGIIFYFIYGDKMYIYRKKYNFLIENYNPKFKHFTLMLQFLKSLTLIYMIVYNYYENISNYILIFLNILNIIIFKVYKNIFLYNQFNIYLIILYLLSLILIILSILENIYKDIFIIKYFFTSIYFIFFCYFNYKIKNLLKKNLDNLNNNLYEIELNYIE